MSEEADKIKELEVRIKALEFYVQLATAQIDTLSLIKPIKDLSFHLENMIERLEPFESEDIRAVIPHLKKYADLSNAAKKVAEKNKEENDG